MPTITRLTDDDLLELLREVIAAAGSQKQSEKVLGIAQQTLSEIVRGRRRIPLTLAAKMGFALDGPGLRPRGERVWIRRGE